MLARCAPKPFLFTVPSPCFVLDYANFSKNLKILERLEERTKVKILLALKAFACWHLFPMLSRAFQGPLWGTCASSLHEARLGREEFGGEVHCFACAYSEDEIRGLIDVCDHVVFNSIAQWRRFRPFIIEAWDQGKKLRCGMRINPEHSEGAPLIYNPCAPNSRLGVRAKDFVPQVFAEGITGLHFHTLCEQNAQALKATLEAFEAKFGSYIHKCQWLNFGGGHHLTRADYDLELLVQMLLAWQKRYNVEIYLEPGEAVALDCGWLTATVLDIVQAEKAIAILDVSPTCHMPDTLEMPYDPPVFYLHKDVVTEATQNSSAPYEYLLAGKSCLAGDVLKATYGFQSPLKIGTRLIFGDMAIYSMVKTTTFNGLNLPSIGVFQDQDFRLLRSFGYSDFKSRLG
ncbi:MAG: carboxynorspermidine decarboxylase [Desulfovibrionaceae bacterium]|nr:carboxynorspermidine decarboxylase [Desulfovibrionaceae bacterium]